MKAQHHVCQRRLAAAGLPGDGGDGRGSVGDGEVEVLQRHDLALVGEHAAAHAVDFGGVDDLEHSAYPLQKSAVSSVLSAGVVTVHLAL